MSLPSPILVGLGMGKTTHLWKAAEIDCAATVLGWPQRQTAPIFLKIHSHDKGVYI
jgi:hypothetical protein